MHSDTARENSLGRYILVEDFCITLEWEDSDNSSPMPCDYCVHLVRGAWHKQSWFQLQWDDTTTMLQLQLKRTIASSDSFSNMG